MSWLKSILEEFYVDAFDVSIEEDKSNNNNFSKSVLLSLQYLEFRSSLFVLKMADDCTSCEQRFVCLEPNNTSRHSATNTRKCEILLDGQIYVSFHININK